MTTLKKGSRGEDVKTLQKLLSIKGYGLIADGIFGEITEEAVMSFERKNHLRVDGIVDDVLWNKLKGGLIHAARSINSIILHCSATPEGRDYSVNTIRGWHKKQGWSDIGYHYIIHPNGIIEQGRDINKIGSHCSGHNTGSIGVCYIGGVASDGKTAKDTRTEAQRAALVDLVTRLMAEYKLSPLQIHCHNDYAAKACPSFKIASFREELG